MNMNENELVSLRDICEETCLRTDPETGRSVRKTAYFSSMEAMIEGAFQFVEYFEKMHREGKVYCSDTPESFRFSLKTGKMIYKGEGFRNVSPGETEPKTEEQEDAKDIPISVDISEFLAPELLELPEMEKNLTEQSFTVETDYYFMAVFLFEYFFHTGSPFEGKKMVNRCFLSPLEKEQFRARQGKFCMDIGENDNTPVKGIQDKLIRYWKEYPDILRKMFQRAFLDGGIFCELRPTEVDWKQVLVRMAMDYRNCRCGFHGFSYKLVRQDNGTFACPKCGKVYYPLSNGMDRILLAEGEKLYECQTGRDPFNKDKVTALIVENRQRKGLYGIKNISQGIWRGLYPNGSIKEIGNGQGIPIWNGMMLRFESGEEWSLRLIQQTEESEVDEYEQ